MTATTTQQSSRHALRAGEVVAALAFQYGLAHLLSRAVSSASRRETDELGGHRVPEPRRP